MGTNIIAAHCTRPKPVFVPHVDAKEKGPFKAEHHWNPQADQTCAAR